MTRTRPSSGCVPRSTSKPPTSWVGTTVRGYFVDFGAEHHAALVVLDLSQTDAFVAIEQACTVGA